MTVGRRMEALNARRAGAGGTRLADPRGTTVMDAGDAVTEDARVEPSPTPGIRAARAVLVGVGVAGLAYGAWLMVTTVSTRSLTGLAIWLVAALVLHDAVLAPVVLVVSRLLRRAGRRMPAAVLAIVQVAVVVGVILTLVVAPEIRAKQLGPQNPSALSLDYGLNLAVMWLLVAVAATLASLLVVRRRRARASAPRHRMVRAAR